VDGFPFGEAPAYLGKVRLQPRLINMLREPIFTLARIFPFVGNYFFKRV
jgi:hypothetical protein